MLYLRSHLLVVCCLHEVISSHLEVSSNLLSGSMDMIAAYVYFETTETKGLVEVFTAGRTTKNDLLSRTCVYYI